MDAANSTYTAKTSEYEKSIVIEAEKQVGTRYYVMKRIGDIVFSLLALLFFSPIYLILATIIYISDPGPVIYRHNRVGKNGKLIRIWKFRSMYVNSDELFEKFTKEQKELYYKEYKLEDDPRITKIGNFLRRSSLDELPQLLNILKGELSLVGPRPVVSEELEKYGSQTDKFLSVKPGLTGYWQANGRNCISYENGRKEMELYYIDHQGLLMDVRIIFQTVGAVLKQKGAQ